MKSTYNFYPAIALFLILTISIGNRADAQVTPMNIAPVAVTDIICGSGIEIMKIRMPADTICASSEDAAKDQYEENVLAMAETLFTCQDTAKCTGSGCELYVWKVNFPRIVSDGDKFIFRASNNSHRIECICNAEDGPENPMPDSIACGSGVMSKYVKMTRQVIFADSDKAADAELLRRVERWVRSSFKCNEPDNCDDEEECSLKIHVITDGLGYRPDAIQTINDTSYASTNRRFKARLECACEKPFSGGANERFNGQNQHQVGAIYPNPANQWVTIPVEFKKNQRALSIQIFDLKGQQILYQELGSKELGKHKLFIEVNDLPNGTYLYHLQSASGVIAVDKFNILH